MSEHVVENPATPSAEGTPELKELAGVVAELKNAVVEMKQGAVDEEKVKALAMEAITASRRQGAQHPEGYEPPGFEGEDGPTRGKLSRLGGAERLAYILETPAKRVAPMLRRPLEDIKHFQRTSDQLVLLSAMTKTPMTELDFFHDEYLPARQAAIDTKTTAEGKELLPYPSISTDVIEKLELQLQVLNLFPVINMPSNPFEFPTKGPRKHIATLAEAVEAGTPKAKQLIPGMPSKLTLTATKFAGEIVTSKELEEEAAIAILPFMESEMLEWLAYDLEDASVNGDPTAPHFDLDVVAADDYRLGWDGLRYNTPATAKVDVGGTALTIANVAAVRAKMGKYGLDPNNLVLLVSIPSLYNLIVDPLVTTVDKYGANATLISGELGRIWGIPITASEYLRTDLDSAGIKGTTGPFTKGIAIIVHKQAFMHGVRRNTTVQVLTELYAESDQDAVLMTTRQAFTCRWPGETCVAQAINVG